MAGLEEQILGELKGLRGQITAVAAQGQENGAQLDLLRSKLFGSEEDRFEAGRLPRLEAIVKNQGGRIEEINRDRGFNSGEKAVGSKLIEWLGGALLVAGGAFFSWLLGHK